MLIQKELESKIMAVLETALDAANLDAYVRVTGVWQNAAAGLSRWLDDETDKPAILQVAVGAPGRETHSDPQTTLDCRVSLVVRCECDATGEILTSIAEVVQACFDLWQGETYQQPFTRFDLTNFNVGDLSVSPGSSPVVSGPNVTVEWPIAFSGSYN